MPLQICQVFQWKYGISSLVVPPTAIAAKVEHSDAAGKPHTVNTDTDT